MAKKSLKDIMNEKKQNLSSQEQDQLNRMKNRVGKYQNYSEDQLMNEINNMRKTSKAVKNIDDNKLNDFKNFLSPMLDNQQKQRLNSIINQLKKK